MQELIIIDDVLSAPDKWERIATFDVRRALTGKYETFPATGKLYHGNVSKDTDVTPSTDEEIDALAKMPGPFYLIIYPGDIVFWAGVVFAVTSVVLLLQRPKIPNVLARNDSVGSSNNELSDRTNKPRVNGRIPDIFGTVRSIPDLIALPYSIFVNHIEVENTFMCIGRGAYDFPLIDGVPSIRDGQTLVSKIEGSSLEVYGPNHSPNEVSPVIQLSIGDPIGERVVTAIRSKAVNGQVLLANNDAGDARIVGSGDIRFGPTNHIEASGASALDFTTVFATTDPLTLTAPGFDFPALDPGGTDPQTWGYSTLAQGGTVSFHSDGTITIVGATAVTISSAFISHAFTLTVPPLTKDSITVNLSGHYAFVSFAYDSGTDTATITLDSPEVSHGDWTSIASMTGSFVSTTSGVTMIQGGVAYLSGAYSVASVSAHVITLTNPYLVTDYWNWIIAPTAYVSPTLEAIGATSTNWVGPFVLDTTTMNEVIANFVALQGAWKDDGATQTAFNIDVQLGVAPCNAAGTLTGPESYYTTTVLGSASVKSARAATLRTMLGFTGRVSVRARRLTPKDTTFAGTIADEIKWRDIYAVAPVTQTNFGDVTTVQALTRATQSAIAVSERQINMLVQRKLPLRISGSTFSSTLTGTNSADEIISFICKDPTLGARSNAEIDFDSIYSTISAIKIYFGFNAAGEFNYTFDNDNVSFEEMLATICNAVFCTAYRQGSVIRLFFERHTDNSAVLFNHRNKIPKTEKRTTSFGRDFDGVEYEWVDPLDDARVLFKIPTDGSATKPKKIQSIGVRNLQHAHVHAYREYNRLLFQRVAIEFNATEEADILINNQRILVTDGTRPDTQEGHVVSQAGLILKLSQPYEFTIGQSYVIFLQHYSGLVESIPITAGVDQYHVVLGSAPALVLSTDADEYAYSATYMIVRTTFGVSRRAYLVTSKTDNDNFSSKLTAINYDGRYYQNDWDFV